MSRYLVDRINGLSNVEVLLQTEVAGLEGHDGVLEAVRWRQVGSGAEVRRPIRHLFLFIGAEPNTHWLAGSGVALDRKGFILTGTDLTGIELSGIELSGASSIKSPARGVRLPLETSRRGVFAIGDVRSESIKRVAAAVGEGAQVVAALHTFLAASAGSESAPARPASAAARA
jgi:thioredoxin reductase (NADPH)